MRYKSSDAENFFLTSMQTWRMDSGWYTSDVLVVITDI